MFCVREQHLLPVMPPSTREKLLKSLSDMIFCGVLLEDIDEVDANEADADHGSHDDDLEEALDVYSGVKLNRCLGSRANVDRSAAHRYLVFDLRDDEFMKSLRVTKPTFEVVWQLIRDDIRFQQRGKRAQRDVVLQLAVALEWFGAYGNGNSTFRIARHYGIGAGTVTCYVRRVRQALMRHYCKYFSWPSASQRAVTSAYHRERFELPGVVGMVDGTHLCFDQRPHIDGSLHFNRKSRYSFNVQVVCNEDKRILMLYTGWPGSCSDSTIFAKSPAMQHTRRHFSGDEFLLGDSGYAVSKYIITPYKKPAASKADNTAFNEVISSARVINENCFGLWKNRWMSLKGIRTQIKTKKDFTVVNNHILACALFHNIGLSIGDVWFDDSNSDDESDEEEDDNDALLRNAHDPRKGFRMREQLKHRLLNA